jgi:hypothetical protein
VILTVARQRELERLKGSNDELTQALARAREEATAAIREATKSAVNAETAQRELADLKASAASMYVCSLF